MSLREGSEIYNHFVSKNQMRLMDFCDDCVKLLGHDLSHMNIALLNSLHKISMNFLHDDAGIMRINAYDIVAISYSNHQPADGDKVYGLVTSLLQELQNLLEADEDIFDIAAYSLWKLCWIHPYFDGNGRLSRALSYIILTLKLGKSADVFTLPALIMKKEKEYQNLLRQTDLLAGEDYKFDSNKIKPLSQFLSEIYHSAFIDQTYQVVGT
jgi:Fic family protein